MCIAPRIRFFRSCLLYGRTNVASVCALFLPWVPDLKLIPFLIPTFTGEVPCNFLEFAWNLAPKVMCRRPQMWNVVKIELPLRLPSDDLIQCSFFHWQTTDSAKSFPMPLFGFIVLKPNVRLELTTYWLQISRYNHLKLIWRCASVTHKYKKKKTRSICNG